MPLEVLEVFVIVERMIANGVVLFGGCIKDSGRFVCESWEVNSIFLGI